MCLIYFMNQSNQLKGITLFLRSLVSRQTPVNSTKWNGISLSKKINRWDGSSKNRSAWPKKEFQDSFFFSSFWNIFIIVFLTKFHTYLWLASYVIYMGWLSNLSLHCWFGCFTVIRFYCNKKIKKKNTETTVFDVIVCRWWNLLSVII